MPLRSARKLYAAMRLPTRSRGGSHTFAVFLREDELEPAIRKATSAHKINRADAEAYFALSTDRPLVRRVGIDEAASRFCDGNFIEGLWTRTDARCQDDFSYKTLTVPSDYLKTVRVVARRFPGGPPGCALWLTSILSGLAFDCLPHPVQKALCLERLPQTNDRSGCVQRALNDGFVVRRDENDRTGVPQVAQMLHQFQAAHAS